MRRRGTLRQALALFRRSDSAVAAIEAAMVFPLLITILCGCYDTGNSLLINQKMITACQTVADVLARETSVDDGKLEDAVSGGRLALSPYNTDSFGVDIAGIEFQGTTAKPVVLWQKNYNSDKNDHILDKADGLGDQNDGLLGVTAIYTYKPFFSGIVIGDVHMKEISYVRPRRGLFITYEG